MCPGRSEVTKKTCAAVSGLTYSANVSDWHFLRLCSFFRIFVLIFARRPPSSSKKLEKSEPTIIEEMTDQKLQTVDTCEKEKIDYHWNMGLAENRGEPGKRNRRMWLASALSIGSKAAMRWGKTHPILVLLSQASQTFVYANWDGSFGYRSVFPVIEMWRGSCKMHYRNWSLTAQVAAESNWSDKKSNSMATTTSKVPLYGEAPTWG